MDKENVQLDSLFLTIEEELVRKDANLEKAKQAIKDKALTLSQMKSKHKKHSVHKGPKRSSLIQLDQHLRSRFDDYSVTENTLISDPEREERE